MKYWWERSPALLFRSSFFYRMVQRLRIPILLDYRAGSSGAQGFQLFEKVVPKFGYNSSEDDMAEIGSYRLQRLGLIRLSGQRLGSPPGMMHLYQFQNREIPLAYLLESACAAAFSKQAVSPSAPPQYQSRKPSAGNVLCNIKKMKAESQSPTLENWR